MKRETKMLYLTNMIDILQQRQSFSKLVLRLRHLIPGSISERTIFKFLKELERYNLVSVTNEKGDYYAVYKGDTNE